MEVLFCWVSQFSMELARSISSFMVVQQIISKQGGGRCTLEHFLEPQILVLLAMADQKHLLVYFSYLHLLESFQVPYQAYKKDIMN